MDSQIVAVFCLSDDMLKGLHHYEDPQCQMTDSEVMTTALVAALYFGGNFEKARELLAEQGYIPYMLGKSRFNRRLHRIAPLFLTLLRLLGETWKALNEHSIYILDSFPIASCDNIRIYCVFRRKATSESGTWRPPIPEYAVHPIWGMPTTISVKSEWVVSMDRNRWTASLGNTRGRSNAG